MIGKVLRGQRPRGLLYYLFGPGRREEHPDPHIVAGWRDAAELESPLHPDGRRDFRQLAGLLNQPQAALGPRGLRQPVWHCVVRVAPGDRQLSDEEFFARVQEAGVLVRTRLSTRHPGQVTGYAVALDGDTARAGGPVWFGGGKLAADLSLPKLPYRWGTYRAGTLRGADLTADERNEIWEHAARTARDARDQIRAAASAGDLGLVSDAAWAASDTLHSAAAALGSRVVRQAADSRRRASRASHKASGREAGRRTPVARSWPGLRQPVRNTAGRLPRPPRVQVDHQEGRAGRELDAAGAASLVRVDHE